MVFGNGNNKKPTPVREKYTPPKPAMEDYVPEHHRHNDEIYHEPLEHLPLVKMADLAREIKRDPIREMALLTKALTYGEMTDLENTIKEAGAPADLDLKPILHTWALNYLKKDDPHD